MTRKETYECAEWFASLIIAAAMAIPLLVVKICEYVWEGIQEVGAELGRRI